MVIGSPGGAVVAIQGGRVVARLPALGVGAAVRIFTGSGRTITARVTAADDRGVSLFAFGGLDGIAVGDRIAADPAALDVTLGTATLGRAIDAAGLPLDGRPRLQRMRGAAGGDHAPVDRLAVDVRFITGIRAIDGPLAFGVGARIGIFGAPGCGKTTLLETIVAGSGADVTVVGLIGERGREAERWIARNDARTTVVCATSDRSAAERLRAAEVAFAQADALRRRGLHVLLVLDSLARVAAAARELAVGSGEPVGRGGYPASVFAVLAALIERAGNFTTGSITLIATVLSDGSDERDPVSDACRAALDGHILLSEGLARQGWFPAIDIPKSASRTIGEVTSHEHLLSARLLRQAISVLDETREARGFGLDPGAGDPVVRRAVDAERSIMNFLRQTEPGDPVALLTQLRGLTDMLSDGYSR